jgi:hypothetical protein
MFGLSIPPTSLIAVYLLANRRRPNGNGQRQLAAPRASSAAAQAMPLGNGLQQMVQRLRTNPELPRILSEAAPYLPANSQVSLERMNLAMDAARQLQMARNGQGIPVRRGGQHPLENLTGLLGVFDQHGMLPTDSPLTHMHRTLGQLQQTRSRLQSLQNLGGLSGLGNLSGLGDLAQAAHSTPTTQETAAAPAGMNVESMERMAQSVRSALSNMGPEQKSRLMDMARQLGVDMPQ